MRPFKICVIGDSGVGKTLLAKAARGDAYGETQKSSIGVDCIDVTITRGDKTEVTLQLWDTAGQERFNAMQANYYRDADFFVLAFDLTKPKTLDNLAQWIATARSFNPLAGFILVGCKNDAATSPTSVTDQAIKNFIGVQFSDSSIVNCFRTSAKTNENVEKLFKFIANSLTFETGKNQVPDDDGLEMDRVEARKQLGTSYEDYGVFADGRRQRKERKGRGTTHVYVYPKADACC